MADDMEKNHHNHFHGSPHDSDDGAHNVVVGETRDLHRNLKGRHMQMIAMCVPPLLELCDKCCAQD